MEHFTVIQENDAKSHPLKFKNVPDSILEPDVNTAYEFYINPKFESNDLSRVQLEILFQLSFIPKSTLVEYSKYFTFSFIIENDITLFSKSSYSENVITPLYNLISPLLTQIFKYFINQCFEHYSGFNQNVSLPDSEDSSIKIMIKKNLDDYYSKLQ